MRISVGLVVFVLAACSPSPDEQSKAGTAGADNDEKQVLLALERKWIEYEFALDTASISPLLDEHFISISGNDTSNKQQELKGIYEKMNSLRKDSVFLDSLKIEEAIVNFYGNTAVVIPVFHTYKTSKGKPVETRTRFYDVWVKKNGNWKAVSSQGTTLAQ